MLTKKGRHCDGPSIETTYFLMRLTTTQTQFEIRDLPPEFGFLILPDQRSNVLTFQRSTVPANRPRDQVPYPAYAPQSGAA